MNQMFSKEDIHMASKHKEKMLNIISHQESANRNHEEVLLHTY